MDNILQGLLVVLSICFILSFIIVHIYSFIVAKRCMSIIDKSMGLSALTYSFLTVIMGNFITNVTTRILYTAFPKKAKNHYMRRLINFAIIPESTIETCRIFVVSKNIEFGIFIFFLFADCLSNFTFEHYTFNSTILNILVKIIFLSYIILFITSLIMGKYIIKIICVLLKNLFIKHQENIFQVML